MKCGIREIGIHTFEMSDRMAADDPFPPGRPIILQPGPWPRDSSTASTPQAGPPALSRSFPKLWRALTQHSVATGAKPSRHLPRLGKTLRTLARRAFTRQSCRLDPCRLSRSSCEHASRASAGEGVSGGRVSVRELVLWKEIHHGSRNTGNHHWEALVACH